MRCGALHLPESCGVIDNNAVVERLIETGAGDLGRDPELDGELGYGDTKVYWVFPPARRQRLPERLARPPDATSPNLGRQDDLGVAQGFTKTAL